MNINTRIDAAALALTAFFTGFFALALARHGGPLLTAAVFSGLLALLLAARCGQEIRDAEAFEARKASADHKHTAAAAIANPPVFSLSPKPAKIVPAAAQPHISITSIEAPTLSRPTLASSAPRSATVDIDLDFTTALSPLSTEKTVIWTRPIA